MIRLMPTPLFCGDKKKKDDKTTKKPVPQRPPASKPAIDMDKQNEATIGGPNQWDK